MRRTLVVTLIAAGAIAASGVAVLSTVADAQPAPPATGRPGEMGRMGEIGRPGGGEMGRMGEMGRPGGGEMGRMGEMQRPPMGGMMRRMREFALIYPAADRNLSGADVQKIAEAFLLINGNHSWKVADVKEEDADRVTFSLTTAEGGQVARFAMDRHTGRPERLG